MKANQIARNRTANRTKPVKLLCIMRDRIKESGEVRRVSSAEAFRLIGADPIGPDAGWHLTTKAAWRNLRDSK
jgi:hypothetical protein